MAGWEAPPTQAQLRDDPALFGAFVDGGRERLLRMVALRLDPRLRGRLDPADVVQDACAEAVARLPEWLAATDDPMPLHLWLRFITGQKLAELHRRHLGAARRDAGREVSLDAAPMPDASAATLASTIAESGVLSPSGVAVRAEVAEQLRAALEEMKPEDREVLVLRHFEQLRNGDVARLLGLSVAGASLRYLRAAKRLRELLAGFTDLPR